MNVEVVQVQVLSNRELVTRRWLDRREEKAILGCNIQRLGRNRRPSAFLGAWPSRSAREHE